MFENGTIVGDLTATHVDDLANEAIAELTGMTAVPRRRAVMTLGGYYWVCRPYTADNVWVRVDRGLVDDAAQAEALGRDLVNRDRENLKIVYIKRG
jgi:hypothetical protein